MTVAKPMPDFTADDMQRLISRCDIDDNGCWVVRNVQPNDYGVFKKDHQDYQAHRVSYKMFKGDVPVELVVDHQCPGRPNRACVNPQHLSLATTKQNLRNAYKHCSAGHPYVFPNAFERNGKRTCVACFLRKLAKQQSRPRIVPGGVCKNGHLLSWDNIYEYVYDTGRNAQCKQCALDRSRARVLAKEMPYLSAVDQRRFYKFIALDDSGCHVWTGQKKRGYGRWKFGDLTYPAHRIAYQLERGKIDSDWALDHLCNNRACCNPDHLEAVPHEVNQERARKRKPQFNKPPKLIARQPNDRKLLFRPPAGHLTVRELAELLDVSTAKVHRWIERRGLPSYKKGNRRYVAMDQFETWREARQVRINEHTVGQLSLL